MDEHHPVFAERDGSPVAIGRQVRMVKDGMNDSTGESCMIRADSTLADARYRSDCPQSIPRRERRIARLVNLFGRRCRSAVQSRDDPIELLIQTETDLLQLRVNAGRQRQVWTSDNA